MAGVADRADPEAQTTYALNPGTFLAHHAAYELRIAAADERFLPARCRRARRSSGVTRPSPATTSTSPSRDVYARSDYHKRPFSHLNYNEVYYNHVWPHIALLTDYLLSDFETRSKGAIEFPARYAQGYAYLRSKVYGDRPGKFMGDDNVRLWMPRHIVATTIRRPTISPAMATAASIWRSATNRPTRADVTVTLDRERIPYAMDKKIWRSGVGRWQAGGSRLQWSMAQ